MKKKLTMINNIVCAILLIATFATMMMPWIPYTKTEKYKVRYCTYCGTLAELDENNRVKEGYVCPGSSEMTLEEYESKKVVTEEVEATEPVVDATEPVADTDAVVADTDAVVTDTDTEDTDAVVADTDTEDTEPETNGDEIITVACAQVKPKYKMEQRVNEIDSETSVVGYVWTTFNHKDLTKQFENEDIVINDIVLAPFVMTLCGIVGLMFCLFNMKGTWHSIFLLLAGGVTVYSYLTNTLLQQGSWTATLGCAIALTVAGLLLFVQFMIKFVRWFVVPVNKK